MYKIKVTYILPEGDLVRVAVCAVKEDGSQIFQMEIQSPYEKGKSLGAYEQAAIEQYTSTVSDIAASAQSVSAEPEVAEASANSAKK